MTANLFGDFVKGRDYSKYSGEIQKGITLHRGIDYYIDTHPKVIELLHLLYPELPKVAGIAVDLYFDHLLSKRWNSFHAKELNDFLKGFYSNNNAFNHEYSSPFQHMMENLIRYNYMAQYSTEEGLEKMCKGVGNRITFNNELYKGKDVFLKYEQRIIEAFDGYMNDAIPYFESWNSK